MTPDSKDTPLGGFNPRSMLVRPAHVPERARFPVVDAHNHLIGDPDPAEMVSVMDSAGVKTFINLTGNTSFSFAEGGYAAERRDIRHFVERYMNRYPGRFACFTMSEFARLGDEVLIDGDDFTERAVGFLEEDVKLGASGLKVMKELGCRFRDREGAVIPVDDARLDPIWACAGKLGVPVLIHTSDPAAFFLPINAENEHYFTLVQNPGWSFLGTRYSKKELLEQRDRMIARHPQTTFICAHVANYPEDLASVGRFLDTHPNAYFDISARIDELGRQPYSARDFLVRYQDRAVFGTDMPVRADIYRSYFRFLETMDEYFEYPDYFGKYGRTRWMIHGLGLPDAVLKKIYLENAIRLIPGLGA